MTKYHISPFETVFLSTPQYISDVSALIDLPIVPEHEVEFAICTNHYEIVNAFTTCPFVVHLNVTLVSEFVLDRCEFGNHIRSLRVSKPSPHLLNTILQIRDLEILEISRMDLNSIVLGDSGSDVRGTLRELSINDSIASAETLSRLLTHFPNLEVLILHRIDRVRELPLREISALTRLKKLGLRSLKLVKQSEVFPNSAPRLEALDMKDSEEVDNRLVEFFMGGGGVRLLNVHWCHQFTGTELEPFVRQLSWFDGSFTGVTDVFIRNLKNSSNMDTLILLNCRVTDQGLMRVVNRLPVRVMELRWTPISGLFLRELALDSTLEELDASDTDFDGIWLMRLAQMPALRTLKLGRCEKICSNHLLDCRGFPNLTHLTLQGCSNLDDSCAAAINRMRKLNSLNCAHSTWITRRWADEVSLHQNLESIDVANSDPVDISVVRSLALSQSLIKIDITECPRIDDEDYHKLVLDYPRISFIR